MAAQNKIKCSKCKQEKGTTTVRLKKLIKQAGSRKKLDATYVCRSCKSGNTSTSTKSSKKLPTSKIICSKCNGKFGTTKPRMEKLIGQFGSLEEVHANYVCRKCRKEHNLDKAGRMKPVKRKRKQKTKYKVDNDGNVKLPSWMTQWTPRPPTPVSASDMHLAQTCWRPDVYCDNNKHCDGPIKVCPYYGKEHCGATCQKHFVVKRKKKKAKKKKK